MSDTNTPSGADAPVDVTAVAFGDESGVQGAGVVAVQGKSAVLVASFADMDSAKAAYMALIEAESKRAIDIEGVLVANADYQGKVHIQKMTDHTTRNGFKWGAIAGVVVGIIFPPSILAGAIVAGAAGAAAGKVGNEVKKGAVAQELASVLTPGSSGIVALVGITAVDAVKATIPDAKQVEAVPVSDETAEAVKAAAAAAGDTAAGDTAPAESAPAS
jgi:uncharacterized membrane protein